MSSAGKSAGLLVRLGTRYRRFENRAFALASEVEYRLRITPRNTRIEPSPFDRRVLRLFVGLMPLLVAALFVGDRRVRLRLIIGLLIVVCVTLGIFLFLDAMLDITGKRPRDGRAGQSRARTGAAVRGKQGTAPPRSPGRSQGSSPSNSLSNSPSSSRGSARSNTKGAPPRRP